MGWSGSTRIHRAVLEVLEQRQLLSGQIASVAAQVDPVRDSAVLSAQWAAGSEPAPGDTVAFYHARPVYQAVTHHQISVANPFGPGVTISPSGMFDIAVLTLPGAGSFLVPKASLMPFASFYSASGLPAGYSNGLSVYSTLDQTDPVAPDFAGADGNRQQIGLASAVQSQLTFSDIPIGTNWVWAEHRSSSGEVLDVSPFVEVTGTLQPPIHLVQGPTHTVAAPPDFAVTLTTASGTPLIGSDFAQPLDDSILVSGAAQVRLQTPTPAMSINWLPEEQWGLIAGSTGSVMIVVGGGSIISYPGIGGSGTLLSAGTISFNSGGYGSIDTGYWGGSITPHSGQIAQPIIISLPDTVEHTYYTPPAFSGHVSFYVDGTLAQTVDVAQSGQAHYRPSGLAAGHHTLLVEYSGNDYFLNAQQTLNFEITPTLAEVTIQANQTQVRQGQAVLLDVSAAYQSLQSSGSLTGTVGIYCDNALLTEATLGSSTVITANLPAGSHQLKAIYLGGGGAVQGESDTITLNVLPAVPPVALLTLKGRTLSGWAVDLGRPDAATQCSILLDGAEIGTVTANRATAKKLHVGRHGLKYVLPKLTAGNHRLTIITHDAATSEVVALGGFGIAVRQVRRQRFGAIARITAMPLTSQQGDPWTGHGSAYVGATSPNGYAYYLTSDNASLIA